MSPEPLPTRTWIAALFSTVATIKPNALPSHRSVQAAVPTTNAKKTATIHQLAQGVATVAREVAVVIVVAMAATPKGQKTETQEGVQ